MPARFGAPNSESSLSAIRASKLRLLGVAVLAAKIALVPLVFDPTLDMPFTVSKAMLSHGLAYLLAAVIGALLMRFGLLLIVRSWLHLPVLAFLLSNVVATLLAVNPTLALFGTHARMLGLGTVADWVVTYLAVVLLVRTRAEAVALLTCALGAPLLVLIYELVQVAGRDPFQWSIDPSIRPFSTTGQAGSLAQYLSTLTIGVVATAILADGQRLPVRGLLILYAGLLLVGVGATGARSALLGLAAGSAVFAVLIWLRHPHRRARALIVLGVAVSAAAIAALIVLTPLGARLAASIDQSDPNATPDRLLLDASTQTRTALYGIAVQIVRERPLFGYGPDSFAAGVPRYRPEQAPEEVRQGAATSAHGWVGYVATSSGLVGLASFIAIIALALISALRAGFRPLAFVSTATVFAFAATGLTTIDDLAVNTLFWVSVGSIAATTAARSTPHETLGDAARTHKHHARTNDAARSIAASILVLTGVAMLAAGINAWSASRFARMSQDSRLVGNVADATQSGLRATQLDPGRADYWETLGLAYVAAQRWPDASAAFDRARKLAPYDVRYAGDFIATQFALGASGASREQLRELADDVVRIDPNNPAAQLVRAGVMQALADLPEALRSVERALALSPGSRNDRLYVTAAQVYIDSGRPADAVRVARQGLAILGTTVRTVPIRYELARALFASGQAGDALGELDIVLTLQPNHSEALRLRAAITAQLGR